MERTLGHQTPVRLDDIIHCNPWSKRRTYPKIIFGTNETRKRRIQSKQKEIKILQKKQYGWDTQSHRMESDPTMKNKRNKQIRTPHKRQNIEVFSRCQPILSKIHTEFFRKD